VKPVTADPVVRASWWGTGVFSVVSVAAAVTPSVFSTFAVAVDTVLFLAGCVLFGISFLRAVGRSRTDAIGIGGLYFLAGDTAPAAIRKALLGSLAVEVVVALGTAFARPYTNLAAGVLVPVYGVGLCGLWASKHGTFGPRTSGTSERDDGVAQGGD
jgi:hypothetical protein